MFCFELFAVGCVERAVTLIVHTGKLLLLFLSDNNKVRFALFHLLHLHVLLSSNGHQRPHRFILIPVDFDIFLLLVHLRLVQQLEVQLPDTSAGFALLLNPRALVPIYQKGTFFVESNKLDGLAADREFVGLLKSLVGRRRRFWYEC